MMPQEKMQVPACMVGVEVKKGGIQSHQHPTKKRTGDGGSRICCFCMCGERDDPAGRRRRKLISGCTSSLAVCIGLIGYTFLGAVLFVAIEGGGIFSAGRIPSMGSQQPKPASGEKSQIAHEWPANFGDSLRNRAVENIWEITVNLNILYRDNWTRLAALEIARFQEQLTHELAKELEDESVAADSEEGQATQWDLASGLLYSITILTTTGYGKLGPKTVLGKTATMAYAAVGIPLMLVYLSSIGQLLSSCAMALFRRRGPPAAPTAPRPLEPFYIRAPPSGAASDGGEGAHLHCSDTLHKSPSISINSSHFNAPSTPNPLVHSTGKGTFSTMAISEQEVPSSVLIIGTSCCQMAICSSSGSVSHQTQQTGADSPGESIDYLNIKFTGVTVDCPDMDEAEPEENTKM